jgi:CBS domain-containing protein
MGFAISLSVNQERMKMPLENIMNKNITCASTMTTVRDIVDLMTDEDVGAVVIVEAGVPKGMVTDRDIVIRCLSKDLDPSTTSVERIMSKGVETVTLQDGIFDVIKTMKLAQIRRVVVVDDGGNAAGLLSLDDILDLLGEEMSNLREAVAPGKAKFAEQAA